MIEIWMKNHIVSDDFFNIVKSKVPDFWFTMNDNFFLLGLQLVTVTLRRRFRSSIDRDK